MLRRNFALAMALAVAASLMLAGAALAKDRNHDRIPDRWEKRHHLSLKLKQGKRDQDHDGLKNRGEWKAKLNPRDADTDNDGVDDGDEHAGTVDSFADDVLTITLAGGGKLSAAVTDDTEIECDSKPGDDRGRGGSGEDRHGDHGDDDGPGDDVGDDHGDDGPGDDVGDDGSADDALAATVSDDDPGDDDSGDDESGDDEGNEDCGTEALVAGAKVLEAELKVRGGEAVWTEVELLAP